MRILALETSGLGGSVAFLDGGATAITRELPPDQRSAQGLAPIIQHVLREVAVTPGQLDLISVTSGPGSFTGLRVGVMTAKTMAYALGCACLGVNTLDVIAANITHEVASSTARLWVVMDAQRQQVFVAAYARDSADRRVRPTAIQDNAAWLAELQPGDVVTGPGLIALERKVAAIEGVTIAPRKTWFPQASAVGELALARFNAGERDDTLQLVPQYYRLSAAEEKLA